MSNGEYSHIKAVIIADNNALIEGDKPLALMRLCGLTLLQRGLHTLNKAGVKDFFIICGRNYEAITGYIKEAKLEAQFNLDLLRDIEDLQLEDEHLLILDANIIFEPNTIKELMEKAQGSLIVCADSSLEYAGVDSSGELSNIGIFRCDKRGLSALKRAGSPHRWSVLPQQVFDDPQLTIHAVSGESWYRIETSEDLKKAEAILWENNLFRPGGTDDFVGHFTRRFPARWLAKWLVRMPITPSQVTLLALAAFVASAVFLSFGQRNYDMLAGVLVLVALILDHVDGLIARMKLSASSFGGWLDYVSDYIGYYSIIFGATVGLYIHTRHSLIWLTGMGLLLLEAIVVQITQRSEETLEAEASYTGNVAPATRDGAPLRRAYDFYTKLILPKYFDWGVTLLVISLGAFTSKMWLAFLIIIIIKFAPTPVGLFMRLKASGVSP
jgi:phosphatidylglycerophosphate synthase/choline kinase